MTHVTIVGAGITGLSLAHYLDAEGIDCRVLEAREDAGGVIQSRRIDNKLLEFGPQRIRFSDPVADLVSDLGLEDEVIEAADDRSLFVYADGKLRGVPTTLREFITTDLLSWRGKFRVLAEPLTTRGHEDETAGELFSRKFGREAYDRLIGPLFGGVYASDPAEMPARHSLSGVLQIEREAGSLLRAAIDKIGGERPPPVSFKGGLQRLPQELATLHDDIVSFDTPVEKVKQRGEGYYLQTTNGQIDTSQVVLTTPAGVTAELLKGIEPTVETFADLTYNPLAIVHLQANTTARGMGYQVAFGEDLHTLGVSWNGPLFGRDGVFTSFLGGMRDPAVVERSPEELGNIARREFESVMDVEADVLAVTELMRGFPAYDHTWDELDSVTLPDGIHLATNYTGRMGVPSRIRDAQSVASRLHESLKEPQRTSLEASP